MTEYIVILVTAGSEDEAAGIAEAIVHAKLAGCVNIIRNIRSIYRWQGKIEDDSEVLMIVKTKRKFFQKIVTKVKELHKYSVPEIIALPVVEGSDNYLSWLSEVTG